MKRKFLFINLLYIATVILMLEVITYSPAEKENSPPQPSIPTSMENQSLLSQIETFANDFNQDPIDAKVDPIWKAIPGYNGVKFDIEESYLAMFSTGTFNEKFMIYEEFSPKVHLEDLPPSPIYKGNPEKAMITLLINVAWGNEHIPKILDVLHKHGVQATFFFDGSWVSKNPDLAKAIFKEKHEIGNHAFSHPDLKKMSQEQTRNELAKTNTVIEETLGIKPQWFAPPSGSFNQNTVNIAHELNMMTILWTVDTIDWKQPETSAMVSRVIAEIENGSMILMHPTKPVAEGLDQMILEIKKKGYRLGTVSDMMNEKRLIKNSQYP